MASGSSRTIADGTSGPSALTGTSRLRRLAIVGISALVVLAVSAWGLFTWFVALQNRNVTSGIRMGQRAPDFSLRDQNGRLRSLHDVSGPKGLLLVFVRSADW
jgi:hypothetical protein